MSPTPLTILLFLLPLAQVHTSPTDKGKCGIGSSTIHKGFRMSIKPMKDDTKMQTAELLHPNDLFRKGDDVPAYRNLQNFGGVYTMRLTFGYPLPDPLHTFHWEVQLDSGSDLTWIRCTDEIPPKDQIREPDGGFARRTSPSYAKLPCSHSQCDALRRLVNETACLNKTCHYHATYASGAWIDGILSSDTMTLGALYGEGRSGDDSYESEWFGPRYNFSIPGFVFGCTETAQITEWLDGIFGLGRGPLSFVSQLGLGKFSHCLSSSEALYSDLYFGDDADLKGKKTDGPIVSTPLLQSPLHPSRYYVRLEGISVGNTRLPIPISSFEMKPNGEGGVLVDSGANLCFMEKVAHGMVVKAFMKEWNVSADEFKGQCLRGNHSRANRPPKMTLHLEGGDLELRSYNYAPVGWERTCLLVVESPERAGFGAITAIGSNMMQDMHVVYDVEKKMVSFAYAPGGCGQYPPGVKPPSPTVAS